MKIIESYSLFIMLGLRHFTLVSNELQK